MPNRRTIRITTTGPDRTRDLGRRIARVLRPGDVVLLHGDLGAGKTTLSQGIATGLGVASTVQSPTFVLVHDHAGQTADGESIALHHLDLYRLSGAAEVESIGYDDYLTPDDGISVVEWPERAGELLPDQFLLVEIRAGDGDERIIALSATGSNDTVARWLGPLVDWPEAPAVEVQSPDSTSSG